MFDILCILSVMLAFGIAAVKVATRKSPSLASNVSPAYRAMLSDINSRPAWSHSVPQDHDAATIHAFQQYLSHWQEH